MPEPPKKGESKRDFLDRCFSALKEEGKSQKQRQGQCLSMWRRSRGGDSSGNSSGGSSGNSNGNSGAERLRA